MARSVRSGLARVHPGASFIEAAPFVTGASCRRSENLGWTLAACSDPPIASGNGQLVRDVPELHGGSDGRRTLVVYTSESYYGVHYGSDACTAPSTELPQQQTARFGNSNISSTTTEVPGAVNR